MQDDSRTANSIKILLQVLRDKQYKCFWGLLVVWYSYVAFHKTI